MIEDITSLLGKIHNVDCLEFMRGLPDKCVDLVLTDPPYGIGASSKKFINGTSKTSKEYYADVCWDTKPPEFAVFEQIFRISENSIIWGGNYFHGLPPCRCFLVWDKTIHGNSYADCEMAWTSFNKVARIKALNMVECNMDGRVHPTQKPERLFKWCLNNNSARGELIFDPFMGSGTTAVACERLGLKWFGCELEPKYIDVANKRIEAERSQLKLF